MEEVWYIVCNHKDGVKTNNLVGNLEWCTRREDTIHALRTGLLRHVNGRFCNERERERNCEDEKRKVC